MKSTNFKIKNMNWLHKGLLSFVGVAFVFSLVHFVSAQYCEDDWGCFAPAYEVPSTINSYDYSDSVSPTTQNTWGKGVPAIDDYANYQWSNDPSCIRENCNKTTTGGTNGPPSFDGYFGSRTQTCSDGKVISIYNECPDNTPTQDQICADSESRGIVAPGFCSKQTAPLVQTTQPTASPTTRTDPIPSDVTAGGTSCRYGGVCADTSGGTVPVVIDTSGGTIFNNKRGGGAIVIGDYPIIIGGSTIYAGWGTSIGTYSTYPTTIYSRPIVNTVVTTVTKYECPDGSLVEDRSTCKPGICANSAIDYPNCGTFKKCINGATNYPTCTICSASYDMYPPIASGTGTDNASSRCVAKCDMYSERDATTGSCKLKACTNGAMTAPYCRDCPAGLDDMWNGKCTARCPDNHYRTSTGCVEYRCTNGATDYPNCGSCPVPKFLQSDGVCRACDTGTSWNGHGCVKNACTNDATNYPDCNLCVTGMEYVPAQSKCMYPCSSGYTRNGIKCDLINTSCNNNALNYPNCDSCPNGYDYILSSKSCLQKCPSGYTRNSNGNCNIDTVTCWNSQTVTVNQSCPPQYRYCDNGRMIEANASCPAPIYNPPIYNNTPTTYSHNCNAGYYYNGNSCVPNVNNNAGATPTNNNNNINIKVCADGTRVATFSNCPIASTGAHKVNTTHVSNISNTSAVCNAMANIYAGMPSYGWIEWGTSENNLNKKTPMQYIGRESVVTYSAPLTGLSANNFYYCRAALANNNGTYRGETLSIITKGQAVTYAKAKVEKVTTKNNVKKVTVTTPTYACKDEYGNKATVKGGEKMLSLSIDKSVLSYSKGDKVSYTINYKNISKVAVKNIELKISLPKEIINIQASKGEIKGNDIILKSDEIGPKSEGVIIVNGEVGTLTEGRNVTVAGILAYDIPSKDNLRDEVSAINVGIVKVGDTAPTSAEGKSKVKTVSSFLPNTLIEWSILIIIIFMVVIAFRAWKAKREDSHH